jgi:hypothetical protein
MASAGFFLPDPARRTRSIAAAGGYIKLHPRRLLAGSAAMAPAIAAVATTVATVTAMTVAAMTAVTVTAVTVTAVTVTAMTIGAAVAAGTAAAEWAKAGGAAAVIGAIVTGPALRAQVMDSPAGLADSPADSNQTADGDDDGFHRLAPLFCAKNPDRPATRTAYDTLRPF